MGFVKMTVDNFRKSLRNVYRSLFFHEKEHEKRKVIHKNICHMLKIHSEHQKLYFMWKIQQKGNKKFRRFYNNFLFSSAVRLNCYQNIEGIKKPRLHFSKQGDFNIVKKTILYLQNRTLTSLSVSFLHLPLRFLPPLLCLSG